MEGQESQVTEELLVSPARWAVLETKDFPESPEIADEMVKKAAVELRDSRCLVGLEELELMGDPDNQASLAHGVILVTEE